MAHSARPQRLTFNSLSSAKALLQQPVHQKQMPAQQAQHDQIQLFRYLAGGLCRLSERIAWDEMEAGEKRRLRRIVAALSSEVHTARMQLKSSHHKTGARNCGPRHRKPTPTAKAAFRKR